ncbi:hypothetical protein QBC36DRAFT_190369 [Triangularia setosa]|uniref:rRNA-processing protein EFG1 n=1 Tax=Triangularia setosa TaxID=2587417 RepID=A0AAN7A5V2_9PEZI|nr:hypothetical protein QBC36DRAFT_190369 [Podospora setosa]
MGIKRSRSEVQASGDDHMHPSRKRARDDRPHKTKPRKPVDLESATAIKKRARAIERLLAHDTEKLPAHKKRELERELAAHKRRIADAQYKKTRAKMISKYHMVRFFERKKAIRIAKQLEKKLAQATDADEIAKLKDDLHKAQVDIDYAIYYPFMEPYISLYAKPAAGEEEKAAQYLHTERPPMWALIEKTREEGKKALEKLQNRKPEEEAEGEGAEGSSKKGSRKAKSAKKDEEVDDGGFFEPTAMTTASRRRACGFVCFFTMSLTITHFIPSFYHRSLSTLCQLNVQLGLLSSPAQEFLPRPTLTASKAYRGPNPPKVVRFITIMPPRKAKRKLGQFVSDTIAQAQASPKKLRQKIISRNLPPSISAMSSAPSSAANDDGIDYQSLASFVEQQLNDPKPITPLQRRLLTDLTSSLKDEEPDTSGHDWVSLLQSTSPFHPSSQFITNTLTGYTDAHKVQAGTTIEYKDEAVSAATATPNPKWTCTLTFIQSTHQAPQLFPLAHQRVPGGFAKKKDAKKYAAKCCVEWLMAENLMPKDGIKVTFQHSTKAMMSSSTKIYGSPPQPPQSPAPVNPYLVARLGQHPSSSTTTPTQSPPSKPPAPTNPTDSTLSLQDNSGGAPLDPPPDEDFNSNEPGGGETPSKRVAALCEKLGFRLPRYVYTSREGCVFDGYADMGSDSWIIPDGVPEKSFGKVERVYSKKFTKEMVAQNILWVLEGIERQREGEVRQTLRKVGE